MSNHLLIVDFIKIITIVEPKVVIDQLFSLIYNEKNVLKNLLD